MNDLEKGRRLLVGTGIVEPRVENGRKSRDAGERPQRGEQGPGRWELSMVSPPTTIAGSSDDSNHKFDGNRHQ